MLRAIVGWVAVDGNDWRGTMRRVNDKVKNVLIFFPVGRWSDALFKRQFRLATRIASSISRPGFATLWGPLVNWRCNFDSRPFRAPERPQQRWDDMVQKFCNHCYGDTVWSQHACDSVTWFPLEKNCTILRWTVFVVACLFVPYPERTVVMTWLGHLGRAKGERK